jgi:tight adherence protein B
MLIAGLSCALALFVYQILKFFFTENQYISRIEAYTGQSEPLREEKAGRKNDGYRQGLGFLARSIEKTGFMGGYKAKLRKKLTKASILMKPEEFLSICIIVALSFGVFGFLLSRNLLVVLLFCILGWIIPNIILNRNITKRLKTINLQLGDTIAILSNAMKAGHSFFQAVDSVSREMTGPIADEFTKLQKEISLGVETETALENMVARVGSDDLELVVTAVLIQRQIGGNLAEILDNISGTIRQRVRTKGEIKTMTAQGRMSGWIISLLPFGLVAVVATISPAQIITLISDPLGIMMVVMALVMEFIGIMLIRKIVNVEV